MEKNDKQYQEYHTWKEVVTQGRVWQATLDELNHSPQVERIIETGRTCAEGLFIGCGTSFYLAESAALSWTLLTGQPARALPGSEVLLYPSLAKRENASAQAMVISRSGRTSEAVRAAEVLRRDLRVPTVGISCTDSSELEQVCDETIVLAAAEEKSTVMTCSFTSMLIGLQYLAARRAADLQFIEDLRGMAEQFGARISAIAVEVERFVAKNRFADYVFLGQGPFHGIAREGALKVMEMSCSYSQFFHALEFRHGPKAIVSPATCLTFFLSNTGYKAEAEVLEEMKELGGVNIAICNRANEQVRGASDMVIELSLDGNELAWLAPSIVTCQLMGFFTGLGKGLNPDLPRNLTRVVILD